MTNEATTREAEAVQAVEEKLEKANREADEATLRSLLSDDFQYTGGMGGSQSKSEWLGGLQSRRQGAESKDREAKTAERAKQQNRGTVLLLTGLRAGESTGYEVEVHGDVAIANQRYSIQDADGSERCLRYVRVYRREGDAWRLISHRYIHAID